MLTMRPPMADLRLRAFCAVLCAVSSLHAHTLHQSTGEAEYNPTTHKLEVSLTVFINDLELALIRQSERVLYFDKTPAAELDAQIRAYLDKTFVVTDAFGKTAKLHWLGRATEDQSVKSDDPAVTLFFEVPLPEGLGGTKLAHTLLHDLYKDQTNLLHLRQGNRQQELSFTLQEANRQLSFPD